MFLRIRVPCPGRGWRARGARHGDGPGARGAPGGVTVNGRRRGGGDDAGGPACPMLARAASERSEASLNRARTGGHERAAWMMPCAGLGGAEPARDRDTPRVLRLLRNRRAALLYQDREFGVGDREHRPFYIDVSPSVIGSPVAPSPA